jgi:hypothetical protein
VFIGINYRSFRATSSSSSSGAEPPLVAGSFGLLNDFLPFYSILNTGYPTFDLHVTGRV